MRRRGCAFGVIFLCDFGCGARCVLSGVIAAWSAVRAAAMARPCSIASARSSVK
jgi:hypothetical protein